MEKYNTDVIMNSCETFFYDDDGDVIMEQSCQKESSYFIYTTGIMEQPYQKKTSYFLNSTTGLMESVTYNYDADGDVIMEQPYQMENAREPIQIDNVIITSKYYKKNKKHKFVFIS